MSREEIAIFIAALNACEPFVPPMLFREIGRCSAASRLMMAANGMGEIKFVPAPEPTAEPSSSHL